MKSVIRCTFALVAVGLMVSSSEAQMGIRGFGLYNPESFLQQAPLVGEIAPSLHVRTLCGEPTNLDEYLGKNVVVIKGSYT